MATVLITCPKTRRPVATGLELDTLSFIWATLREQRVRCPACGRTHIWNKVDAYLPPHPPKPPPGGFLSLLRTRTLPTDAATEERESRIPWPWVQVGAAAVIIAAAWFLAEGPGGGWVYGLLNR